LQSSLLPSLPSESENVSIYTLLHQLNNNPLKEIVYYKAWLVAVERAVNNWWLSNNITHSVNLLFELFHSYQNKTENIYQNDPVSVSLKYLTLTTICALIDKIIVQKYDVFARHRIDFPLPSFNFVLLPEHTFMVQLQSIELYYKQRADTQLLPGILTVSAHSAAVAYAITNTTICNEWKRILLLDEKLQQDKRTELEKKLQQKNELENQIANYGPHDVYEYYNRYTGRCGTTHDRYCRKCSLESSRDKLTIDRHEKILPKLQWQQLYVVFNFFCESDILQWRDCLFLVSQAFMKPTNKEKLFSWAVTFSHHYRPSNSKTTPVVTLSSSINTFHSKYNFPIFMKSNIFSDLIVDNGFNLELSVENNIRLNKENTEEKEAEFEINKITYNIKDKVFMYLSNICRKIVDQNVVIASLHQCPEDITESEWKSIASIREGILLQYHNIYSTIHSRSVPYERIGTVFLLMNTLWQVCEPDDPLTYTRQAHRKLCDKEFVSAFIEELDKFLEGSSDQWNKCHILMNIALITVRCFTISESLCPRLKQKIISLLRKIRNFGKVWIKKLSLEVAKVLILKDIDENMIHELREKLCFTSMAILFTYYTDPCKLSSLFDSSDDYLSYIIAINCLHDNHNASAIDSDNILYPFLCLVHRIVLNCYSVLSCNISSHLTLFINQLISVNEKDVFWIEHHNSNGIFTATAETGTHYEINVITGKLLIEGRPVNKLPECFISKQFIRVFGTALFEVSQRDKYSFITKCSYSNSKFLFSFLKKSDIIRSIDEGTKDELILIDHTQLLENLPKFFVNSFSHWLDRKKKIIYFKPILFKDKSFFNLEKVRYLIEYTSIDSSWRLYDKKSEKYLVDYYSSAFGSITNSILSKLEAKNSFHCWYKLNYDKVDIELPRYDLSFTLSLTNQKIYYNSMTVSTNQKLGTLLGLENYVKIEAENDPTDQVIIVPHCSINLELINSKSEVNSHQSVAGDINKLYDPPFFTYKINHDLGRLDGPDRQEAWLYLSYLHGCTSSIFRDDFTSSTGTEEAIRILQLPICHSLQPYNSNSMRILEFISTLSPSRTFAYKTEFQGISWPSIPSSAASDAFTIIVDQLRNRGKTFILEKKSSPLLDLEKKARKKTPSKQSSCSIDLSAMYYERRVKLYSPLARITNYSQQYNHISLFSPTSNSSLTTGIQMIAHAIHNNQLLHTNPTFSLLEYLKKITLSAPSADLSFQKWNKEASSFPSNFLALFSYVHTIREDKYHVASFLSYLFYQLSNNSAKNSPLLSSSYYYLEPSSLVGLCNFVNSNEKEDEIKLLSIMTGNPTVYPTTKPKMNIDSIITQNQKDFDTIFAKSFPYLSISRNSETQIEQVNKEIDNAKVAIKCKVREVKKIVKTYCNDRKNILNANRVIWSNKFTFLNLNEGHLISKFDISSMNKLIQGYFEKLSKWRVINLFSEMFGTYYPQHALFKSLPPHSQQRNVIPYHSQDIRLLKGKISDSLLEKALKLENLVVQFPWIASGSSINESTEFPMHIHEEDDVEKDFLLDLKQSWNYPSPTFNFDTSNTFCENFIKKCQVLDASIQILQNDFLEGLKNYLYPDKSIIESIPYYLPFKKELLYSKLLRNSNTDENEYSLILAVAIIDSLRMKMKRMRKYIHAKDTTKLQKEFIQADDVNLWKARDYPTWLLFEIENNLSIRPIQAKVAMRMIHPENNENSLMQLNMGEGKTAVIAPIVASHLAYKQDSIVRVIVPQHLLPTNYSKMQYQLGRLLNHPVYTIPCSRDLHWNIDNVTTVLKIMRNAIASRSVMISKPEYIKSFFLKYFETAVSNDTSLASLFGEVLNEDLTHCRDIIDEADAILHFKSQLIYTLGNQCTIDGKSYRWQAIAIIIECILSVCLDQKQNSQYYSVEVENYIQLQRKEGETHIFPKFRFLGEIPDYFLEFIKSSAVCKYLDEKIPSAISKSYKTILKQYICDPNLTKEVINQFDKMNITEEVRVHVLTLRGFMAFNIYQLVLKKRWRVEYGVNPKGDRMIAVPFRGKDDASENTEFGHPDVAISLSFLSYYYSGLSDHQIENCLLKLDSNEDFTRNSLYLDWVNSIDPAHRLCIPQQFKDINLSDFQQKTTLFNTIRKSMVVIQFFLINIVFPKESKQFDNKIIATSCIHALSKPIRHNVVTGFSGTNDIKLLLPLSIKQNDIPQLLGTNAFVTKNILKNKDYYSLPASIEPNEFLQCLANYLSKDGKKPNVLLDVGALVQELSNKELAKKWLALRNDARGVIYFNENNEIVVLSRAGNIKSFSYFNSEDTNDYLVYLDEVHTRGTDIVLPSGYHAIVTLGARLTKDKFVQGCMRMRKLGFEHTLSFWSSFEVHTELISILSSRTVPTPPDTTMNHSSTTITSLEIIEWTIRNSVNMIRDGFTLWGSQAINHLHLQSLIESCDNKIPSSLHRIKYLGTKCAVPDAQSLMQIYGGIRNKMKVPEMMRYWGKKYHSHPDLHNILQKCTKFVKNVECYAQLLSEEQERELEAEMEEEIKKDRPPPNTPCKHNFDKELIDFYHSPQPRMLKQMKQNRILLPMEMHFADCTLSKFKFQIADERILCTNEFCNTVKLKKHNSTLRPISWCMIVRSSDRHSILSMILIAPHEVDELAHYSSTLSSIHKMVPRFTRDQSILIDKNFLCFNPLEFTMKEWEDLEALLAQLSILSGSIFFGSEKEELYAASYLGLCPAPYSKFEKLAFENEEGKIISSRGFVNPEFRCYSIPAPLFSFSQDPLGFLNELYSIRAIKNLIITDVGKLVHKAKFILNTVSPKKILSVDHNKHLAESTSRAKNYFDDYVRNKLQLSESEIEYLCNLQDPVELVNLVRQLSKISI
jgi:hypothetical protein